MQHLATSRLEFAPYIRVSVLHVIYLTCTLFSHYLHTWISFIFTFISLICALFVPILTLTFILFLTTCRLFLHYFHLFSLWFPLEFHLYLLLFCLFVHLLPLICGFICVYLDLLFCHIDTYLSLILLLLFCSLCSLISFCRFLKTVKFSVMRRWWCWNSWGCWAWGEKFMFVTLPQNEWIGANMWGISRYKQMYLY